MGESKDAVAHALYELLQTPNESDSNLEIPNVVDGLYAQGRIIAHALRDLGSGDNEDSPTRGAIASLAATMEQGMRDIANALYDVASALRSQK